MIVNIIIIFSLFKLKEKCDLFSNLDFDPLVWHWLCPSPPTVQYVNCSLPHCMKDSNEEALFVVLFSVTSEVQQIHQVWFNYLKT